MYLKMGLIGCIYKGKKQTYLGIYSSFHSDLYAKLPPEFKDCKQMSHIKYNKGKRNGGIDIFLINPLKHNPKKIININKIVSYTSEKEIFLKSLNKKQNSIKINKTDLQNSDKDYSIQFDIIKDFKEYAQDVMNLCRADIKIFCKNNFSKNNLETSINYVKEIIPLTKIRKITKKRILEGGKQEFFPECHLQANIDFGDGCISSWIPEKDASFDGEFFKGYFSYPWGECNYCYAKQKHGSFPKRIFEIDSKRLKEELLGDCYLKFKKDEKLGKPVEILRFGKRTEPWTPFTKDNFILTLETMTKTKTKGIITTKFLPFDKEITNLIKKTNSVLLYCIGWDFVETGAQKYGCNNKWRLEQTIKYREAGINALPYLLISAHKPPEKREKEILDLNIPLQLLPIRFKSKELVTKITGESWEYLKNKDITNRRLFPEGYEYQGSYDFISGELACSKIHKDWLNIIKDNNKNIRICHHNNENFFCGGCFQEKGVIKEMDKKIIKRNYKWKRAKKQIKKEQKRLFT